MGDTLRAATLEDSPLIADVLTAARPDDPVDPVMFRFEWEHAPANWVIKRFVIVRDGRDVGACGVQHLDWSKTNERFAPIFADFLPQIRAADDVASALAPMEDMARADGARLAVVSTRGDDRVRLEAYRRRGYSEDRRGKRWELDLVAGRERLLAMAEESRARMREERVRLLPLSEDRDPDRYQKLWRVTEDAARDIPSSHAYVESPFEEFMDWIRTPGMYEDRLWIAREGDAILGMSVLEYPLVRGVVNTAFTATAPTARGRGIARALKCETMAQAIALGVPRVRTGNDAKNDPILHINESMGYRLVAERIDFHKEL